MAAAGCQRLTAADGRPLKEAPFDGVREAISLVILAVATILVVISVALLATVALRRRRSDPMCGVTGGCKGIASFDLGASSRAGDA